MTECFKRYCYRLQGDFMIRKQKHKSKCMKPSRAKPVWFISPPQDIVAVLKFVNSKSHYFPKRATVFPLCGSFPGRLSLREDCVGPGSSAFAGDTVWWFHQCWDGQSSESHEVVQLPHLTCDLQSLFPWDLSQFSKAGTTVKISGSFSFSYLIFHALSVAWTLFYFCYFLYLKHYPGMRCLCVI